MRVFILAGGLGTRLRSVISDLPKPMAPVNERPFLEHLMDYWILQGADEFVLSVGHLAEKVQKHFQSAYQSRPINYVKEPEPLGTGGALVYALGQLKNLDEEMVIINGDTFFEIDFQQMKAFHQKHQANLTMALRRVEQNDRYSPVSINTSSQITEFHARRSSESHCLINGGIYYGAFQDLLTQVAAPSKKFSLEDDFFPKLVYNQRVFGFVQEARFIDIGIPSDYEKSQSFFQYAT